MILRKRKRSKLNSGSVLNARFSGEVSQPMEFLDTRESTVMQRRNKEQHSEERPKIIMEDVEEEKEETKLIDTTIPRNGNPPITRKEC